MEKYKRSNKLNMHHGAFSRSLLVDKIRKSNHETLTKVMDITRPHRSGNRTAK